MTFEEAVRKMIKQYFADMDTSELNKGKGKKARKYNKKYFDSVAEEHKIDQSDLKVFKGEIDAD